MLLLPFKAIIKGFLGVGTGYQSSFGFGMNKADYLKGSQNCKQDLQLPLTSNENLSVGPQTLGKDKRFFYEMCIHKRFQVKLLIFIDICLDSKCSSPPLSTKTPLRVSSLPNCVPKSHISLGGLYAEAHSKDLMNQGRSAEGQGQRMHLQSWLGRESPRWL